LKSNPFFKLLFLCFEEGIIYLYPSTGEHK